MLTSGVFCFLWSSSVFYQNKIKVSTIEKMDFKRVYMLFILLLALHHIIQNGNLKYGPLRDAETPTICCSNFLFVTGSQSEET